MEVKRCGEKEFLSADKLRIRENEIHIWCICWPEMTDFWKNHEYILSEQESEQAGKFRFPEDRMRYIAGKLIVRILLKRYLDVETVDFSVNELGKPYHKKIAGKRTVDFNISHSGEFILAVFAVGMDIGVDMYYKDRIDEQADLTLSTTRMGILALANGDSEIIAQLVTLENGDEALLKALCESMAAPELYFNVIEP